MYLLYGQCDAWWYFALKPITCMAQCDVWPNMIGGPIWCVVTFLHLNSFDPWPMGWCVTPVWCMAQYDVWSHFDVWWPFALRHRKCVNIQVKVPNINSLSLADWVLLMIQGTTWSLHHIWYEWNTVVAGERVKGPNLYCPSGCMFSSEVFSFKVGLL